MVCAAVAVVVLATAGCASSTDSDEPMPSGSAASTSDHSGSVTSGSAASGSARPDDTRTLANLGDSFSAAVGVQPLVEASYFLCMRSARNFAHLLAARETYRLDDVSCGGADTSDFFDAQYDGVPPQIDAVSADTDVVTVMIGGNDSSVYTRAIGTCSDVAATDPTGSPCRDAHGDEYVDIIRDRTYPSLRRALSAVREKAPDARVVAVGYPWILPEQTGCYPTMRVATGDVPYLHDLQAELNDAIRRAARVTGVTFVDMSSVSQGHDACAPVGQRWIEPQTGANGAAPVHPNELGQQAIADQVAAVLR